MKRPKLRIAWLMAAICVAAVVFASLRYATTAWAGVVLLLTLGMLTCSILAAAYLRAASRAFWAGFALCGWMYMGLTVGAWWREDPNRPDLPTTNALVRLSPYLDPVEPATRANDGSAPLAGIGYKRSPTDGTIEVGGLYFRGLVRDPEAPNRLVRTELERPISMPFPNETALVDVVNYIKVATTGPRFPTGLPIYIDPVGLTESYKTVNSPITLQLDGVPLRTSLALLLGELDLTYRVEGGVLIITSSSMRDAFLPVFMPDSFLRVGHCWWTWLAGVFGGCAAVYLRATGQRQSG